MPCPVPQIAPTAVRRQKGQKGLRLNCKPSIKKKVKEQVAKLKHYFANQWPTTPPTVPATEQFPSLVLQKVVRSVTELFQKVHQNKELHAWIQQLQDDLSELPEPEDESEVPIHPRRQPFAQLSSKLVCPDLLEIFKVAEPPTFTRLRPGLTIQYDATAPNTTELEAILRPCCTMAKDKLYEAFGRSLHESVQAYKAFQIPLEPDPRRLSRSVLKDHSVAMKLQHDNAFSKIMTALLPQSDSGILLSATAVWASITPHSLLAVLARSAYEKVPMGWRKVLVGFATRLALFQRAERLLKASKEELIQELRFSGQETWNAEDRPEWLLLEIENNFTIRQDQAEMANEMISPTSKCNSIYQLAMGGGKTSVIIILVATAIADGRTLARILTLKPLLRQTLGLLSHRLGRLINRHVYHVPFSRSTQVTVENMVLFAKIYEETKQTGGILVALPEEVLSLQLAAQENWKSSPTLGHEARKVIDQLSSTTRNIIDESDEVLDLKSQLVYTMGTQQQMEGHPKRWLITMEVIERIGVHAIESARVSRSFEVIERGPGRFPSIRFVENNASQPLIDSVVDDLKHGRISTIRLDLLPHDLSPLVIRVISDRGIDKVTFKRAEMGLRHAPHIWSAVLVLRGLISFGAVRYALEQRRFFVDYGLQLERTLLAVPYRAKGIPYPSSEFAQPEIVIILTVLAYYHTGLSDEQVQQAFSILFEESDASAEYSNWIPEDSDVAKHLRLLKNINLDDESSCKELFPQLRHCRGILNFYLKKVIFPRHANEYTKRLAASAWDIPSSNAQHLTVGFSGTNDNRSLLPLSTKQRDLPSQKHTNAMVMDLIIREENRSCILAADETGSALTTRALLKCISEHKSGPSVIIDVGAQILDLTNRDVASMWLETKPGSRGAIYYDESDEPQVMDRAGNISRLAASPLRDRLDNVLIFLDQARSRGVDLTIPAGVSAAVILGPGLSRDRLVQACMRMRKLGMGHSLVFIAPPDVHRSILDSTSDSDGIVTSADILTWSINQTCLQLKKNASHWISQGADFVQRESNLRHYITNGNIDKMMMPSDPMIIEFMESMEQPESRSLEQLYGYREPEESAVALKLKEIEGKANASELLTKWRQLDPAQAEQLSLGEEQEREVSVEVQQQKTVLHPLHVAATKPVVRGEVRNFVETGRVNSSRFRATKDLFFLDVYPAFVMVERTSAKQGKDAPLWKLENLYVTRDFVESVDISESANIDPYLRPIQWILTSTSTDDILIVSPFEANELHSTIQQSSEVRLHLFAPNVNKASRNLSSLDFLVVGGGAGRTQSAPSPQAIRDINLLAGSTFINSFEEYEALRIYLGIIQNMQDHYQALGQPIGGDGFVDVAGRRVLNWTAACPFNQSPIPFFQAWYSLRKKGQDFSDTHIGCLLNGKPLTEEDFGTKEEMEVQIKTERTQQEESLFVREDSPMQDFGESSSLASGSVDPMDLD